jgi:RND family efflux transporter MFP subunit
MRRLLTLATALVAAISLDACSRGESSQAEGNGKGPRRELKFPVEVQNVEIAKVEYTIEAVGSVDPFEQVSMTARVAGVVDRVNFREGDNVAANTPLVEIDAERYKLAVDAAQATSAQAQASLAEAEAGLKRRESASERNPGLIRGEELDTWRTKVTTAQAQVQQAKAALDQAKLNLRDAFVSSPIAGTIQTRTVQTGQYVQPGSVLGTLVRRDPLMLRFQVPEQDASPLRDGMTVRFRVSEANRDYTAKITHVAEVATSASRMVPVTAQIDDLQRAELRAGAFARVSVPVGGKLSSPVIQQTAIRPSERGFLAFVVENGKARERILTLGMRTPEGKVEVKEGLASGDKLVTRGAEALKDGVDVVVKQ